MTDNNELHYYEGLDPHEVVLIQYTGLTDVDGNEIYKDDLMKSNKGIIFRVIWNDKRTKWEVVTPNIFNTKKSKNYYKSLLWAAERCVIIGNIHNNPKLIEERYENL